jgi:hypothetical protein
MSVECGMRDFDPMQNAEEESGIREKRGEVSLNAGWGNRELISVLSPAPSIRIHLATLFFSRIRHSSSAFCIGPKCGIPHPASKLISLGLQSCP